MNAVAEALPQTFRSPDTRHMANALRMLAVDAVQQANSGHPGMPMGMAEIAVALWSRHLKHNPADPDWPDRDRFVLSNGHGSMLLYALLHLTGYDLPMDELKRFRQWGSKTPGHPEVGMTPGVETTTGPLGQGFANAVGMALAETLLAREFNRPGHEIVDHRTYVFVGDGCLMEGVSHEAASLAGTLGLNKLTVFYDDNGISIDGHVQGWFSDDTPQRFAAYGWHVIPAIDGHDVEAVSQAIDEARASDRPTLICCKTTIGRGAPSMAGTHDVHGAPLGANEVQATRLALDWPHAPFEIPLSIHERWNAREQGAAAQQHWQRRMDAYRQAFPAQAAEFERRMRGALPANWRDAAHALVRDTDRARQTIATRKASQNAIEGLARVLPELLGGSADLTGSNLTRWKDATEVNASSERGNYLHYGVREFGMSAMMNGVALHRGYLPFGGTFLTFSDYSRNALRMAALMKTRTVFVFTHDSIGLGEDGPTHQPIEHAASLRLIPGLDVWRPCDAVETAQAWVCAVEHDRPACLLLSRQNVPFVPRDEAQTDGIERGGYVLADWPGACERDARRVVLIATGSEVALALAATEPLKNEGILARVVSMPSTTVFDRQCQAWRERVLPEGVPRVAIEAGVTAFWRQYVGLKGGVVGIDRFGESAPASELYAHFGVTTAAVIDEARRVAA
ncbi:transketolase [Caballeronia sp. ATUFL_M2_KS44]|uniref:transketolase n=1 Tax=Caballeronia sp. ATUFL_M2_KS44 TaxID=2921767 RepID=UPI00202947DE|nr:transketolase [Caballeronia sp. ATUFL_M2_KS44]